MNGRKLDEVSLRRYLKADRPNTSGAPIAVLVADGQIMRGESGYSPMPLFGGDVMGSDSIARAWRQVRDSDAKAVVFRVNSPGGSAVASEIIRAEMVKTAAKIPVVVSMGDVAASGGYWITCGATRIVADPGTITASIGVFSGHLDMAKFWDDKLGVTWGRIDTAPNASLYSSVDCLDAGAAEGGAGVPRPDLRRVPAAGVGLAQDDPRAGGRDRPRARLHRRAGQGEGPRGPARHVRRRGRGRQAARGPEAGRCRRAARTTRGRSRCGRGSWRRTTPAPGWRRWPGRRSPGRSWRRGRCGSPPSRSSSSPLGAAGVGPSALRCAAPVRILT